MNNATLWTQNNKKKTTNILQFKNSYIINYMKLWMDHKQDWGQKQFNMKQPMTCALTLSITSIFISNYLIHYKG